MDVSTVISPPVFNGFIMGAVTPLAAHISCKMAHDCFASDEDHILNLSTCFANLFKEQKGEPEQDPEDPSSVPNALKMKAPDMSDFSGKEQEWPKWKCLVHVALSATGHDRILFNEKHAKENPGANAVFFAKLAAACVEGAAHHIVDEFKDQEGASLEF